MMGRNFQEGQAVAVPCRHCGSLSIKLFVQAGESVKSCPKCRKETRFRIKPKPAPCEIRSEPVETPESPTS
jgi:phage FluMu protein Com